MFNTGDVVVLDDADNDDVFGSGFIEDTLAVIHITMNTKIFIFDLRCLSRNKDNIPDVSKNVSKMPVKSASGKSVAMSDIKFRILMKSY